MNSLISSIPEFAEMHNELHKLIKTPMYKLGKAMETAVKAVEKANKLSTAVYHEELKTRAVEATETARDLIASQIEIA